jgi:hypothetical protein
VDGDQHAAAAAQFFLDTQGRERCGRFRQRRMQLAMIDGQGFPVHEAMLDRATRKL